MNLLPTSFLSNFPGNQIIATVPDREEGPMYHHSITDVDDLVNRNKEFCGVFFTINELDQKLDPGDGVKKRYRTKKMLKRIRAVFADDDTPQPTPRTDWPLKPSLIVNSSPGKYHYYWLIEDTAPAGEWIRVQKGLNKRFGTDESASQVNRVLRLPGYYHCKKDPFYVTFEGDGLKYSWETILLAFPPLMAKEEEEETSSSNNWLQHLQQLDINEAEGAHPQYVAAALSLANTGTPKDVTEFTLIGAVQGIFAQHGRVFESWRSDRIREAVKSAYEKIDQEHVEQKIAVPEPAVSGKRNEAAYTYLPMPGGGLWHLVQWIKSTMRYPNDTIAILVAEHIVSTFGGGKWSLMGNTTTRKRILLGPPGCGKNTIVTALDQICVAMEQPNDGGVPYVMGIRDYIGSDAFTFANQHKQIENHRVRCFVVNEAGQVKASNSGDKDMLYAYQLQALSTKAGGSLKPREFSVRNTSADKQVKTVYGGVWVWFHESVVDSYAKSLVDEDAFATGDFSRTDAIFVDPVIRVINKQPTINQLPIEVKNMIINLVHDFRTSCIQRGDAVEAATQWHEVDYSQVERRLEHMEMEIVNMRNESYTEEDTVMTSVYARRFEKIITTLLVCALADASFGSSMTRPVVTNTHLDYAITRQDAIDEALGWHTTAGKLSDTLDQLVEWFVEMLKKGGKTLFKWGNWSRRVNGFVIDDTYIQQKLTRKTEYKQWKSLVYGGDAKRALPGFIEELHIRQIVKPFYNDFDDKVNARKFVVSSKIIDKKLAEDPYFRADKRKDSR